GTYRLLVRLPPGSESFAANPIKSAGLAIHIPWTYSAYALWINGSPVASNGAVGIAPGDVTPQLLPVIAPCHVDGATLEIIGQLSNLHRRQGGIWNAPLIGAYDKVVRRQALRGTIDNLLAGAILFMGIYHVTIYMWFKERKASL